ncbi:MAG: hypothetical protein JNJ71_03635 [Rubrivivax sp.]|nr:hypothetical protein [Rubrivivax sp.]
MSAALRTAGQAWGETPSAGSPAGLNPALQTLRVSVGRQAGWMVRADPVGAETGVSYWYSADGALLRLAQGRLHGFTDGTRSWQVSRAWPAVDWQAVLRGQQPALTVWVDQQPGYRVAQRFERQLQAVDQRPAAASTLVLPPEVRWFREFDPSGHSAPIWYAVDLREPVRVLYGETCLEPGWCLSWQVQPKAVQP